MIYKFTFYAGFKTGTRFTHFYTTHSIIASNEFNKLKALLKPNQPLSMDYLVSVEFVDYLINNLSKGKAASLNKLTEEHLIYSHPCVVLILTKIFNLMIKFEYVPDEFGRSLT